MSGTPEQRPEAGDEHAVGEGLGQEVVGADGERLDLVALAGARGEHQHWRAHSGVPQARTQVEAEQAELAGTIQPKACRAWTIQSLSVTLAMRLNAA